MQAYLAAGVPADKIVVGVRFVATGWQGVPSANNGLDQDNGGPAPGSWGEPGSIGFQDIEDKYLPTCGWENDALVLWLYNAGALCVVRVYNSAAEAHFDDTRKPDGQPSPKGATGVGSGLIDLKVDSEDRPIA